MLSLAHGSLALSLNPFWYNSHSLPLAHVTQKPTNALSSREILLEGAFSFSIGGDWDVQDFL